MIDCDFILYIFIYFSSHEHWDTSTMRELTDITPLFSEVGEYNYETPNDTHVICCTQNWILCRI